VQDRPLRRRAIVVEETALGDVKLLSPQVFRDERGFFYESYNERVFHRLGIPNHFVQDNHSSSKQGVLRGLHYQKEQIQGKLVRAIRGRIYDVAVDLRESSPTFKQWVGYELSDENRMQLWIPPGFAHGFVALSERADVAYKATDFYAAQFEHCILWNDPELGIRWPLDGEPNLSKKDAGGVLLKDAELFP
jgi:dTDP-4-dehydrorhamnose 3,5-epimerase